MGQGTYKIGEAASLLNLKTYVLRFWETEFSQITPLRTEKGQRLYTEKDIALLKRIRFLLHDRGLTIEGAKRILQEEILRGQDFTDSSLLYLADEHEDFSSSIAPSLDEVEESATGSDPIHASINLQTTPDTNKNENLLAEPLFSSNEESDSSPSLSLHQTIEPSQLIKQNMVEQNFQQSLLEELEDVVKILRSHANLGDHAQ